MTVEHKPHIQTAFRIGAYTVYASSSRDVRFTERGAYVPKDLAFHLAPNAWSRTRDVKAVPFSRGDHRVQKTQDSQGRTVRYVWWDDMGTLEQDLLESLVYEAHEALARGDTVEVGCIGGHGRTGTFLAALLVKIEQLGGDEAIRRVKEAYCSEAVETPGQRGMVRSLATALASES